MYMSYLYKKQKKKKKTQAKLGVLRVYEHVATTWEGVMVFVGGWGMGGRVRWV